MADYVTYNRDINTTGSITARAVVPEYGSSVSFEFVDYSFYTQDYHENRVQKQLNNFLIEFNLNFSQKTEDEAKSLISFLERVSTGVSGAKTNFNFNENNSDNVSISFPTGNIYKNISGLLIDNYDVKFHNGLFDINLLAKTNLENTFTKWKSSTFLNSGNTKDFISGTTYEKFDIIYVDESINFFNKKFDERQRYFYLQNAGKLDTIQDVVSEITGSSVTDEYDYSGILTRNFFFEPDDQVSVGFKNSSNVLKFDTSIQESQNLSKNKNIIQELSLSFSNRSDKETFSLLHFLEKHESPKYFKLNLPKLFKRDKFFKVLNFNHTFIYKDCNNINLQLREVVEPQKEPNEIVPFHLAIEYNGDRNFESFPILTEDYRRINLDKKALIDSKKIPKNVFDETEPIVTYNLLLPTDINFRLNWTNLSGTDEGFDLDINVIDPSQELYNFSGIIANQRNPGLINDVRGEDLEIIGETDFTENLFWLDEAPNGNYQYFASMFNKNTDHSGCNYVITVLTGNNVAVQSGSGSFTTGDAFDATGTKFTYNYTKIT